MKEQLDSLLAQTYPNFEIIICDDASLDDTHQLLARYKTNEHIHIYCNPHNIGLTNNITKALDFCKGEFIAFCDQDDIWRNDKLEILYQSIKQDVLIYSDSELVDEHGKSMDIKLSQLRNMHTGNNNLGFVFSNCVWGHTMLINASLIKHILPIPANVPHDSWSGFVAASVNRIKYIDKPLNLYRQHKNTVTSTLPAAKYISDKGKKLQEYQKNLNWIKALTTFSPNKHKGIFKTLVTLYVKKEKKKFVWPLFIFLLKHRTAIFAFSKKNYFSKLNEIRKHARGIDITGV